LNVEFNLAVPEELCSIRVHSSLNRLADRWLSVLFQGFVEEEGSSYAGIPEG